MNAMTTIHDIFSKAGGNNYGEAAVTQLEHALQCAALAEEEGASPALIVSALLHDVGHLINPDDCPAAARGEDAYHESIGAAFLEKWFGSDVTEPVRLHVPAKRYLTAVEPGYFSCLSPASIHSLELQGGPFSHEDADRFLERAYAQDAVRLRRWDDGAKVRAKRTPDFAHFNTYIAMCLCASSTDGRPVVERAKDVR